MWRMHDRLSDDGNAHAYHTLVESIRLQGQKQAALGRYIAGSSEYDVELIFGARRLAAARELGVDLLVEIREIDDRDALIEMDIENRVRQDISPYERGISYRRWLRSGLFSTQTEIAKALGVSEAQICRLLKFAELPAAVIAAFKTPDQIREEWAGTLSSLCKEGDVRDGILRRARSISTSNQTRSPQDVYDTLVCDGKDRIVRSRARDQIVKNQAGQPLFRIGFRATTVHLIVRRDYLSADALDAVAERLRASLEEVTSPSERLVPPEAF